VGADEEVDAGREKKTETVCTARVFRKQCEATL